MNVLQLTQKQLNDIRAVEVASFSEHCKRHGLDTTAHAAVCVEDIRQSALSLLDNNCDLLAAPEMRDTRLYYEQLASATDLWDASRLLSASHQSGIVEKIVENAHRLTVNMPYLEKLARDIGLSSPSQGRLDSLRDLMLAIPQIGLWGYEFSAFLSGGSTIHGVPCICIFHHLHSVSKLFLNVVAPVIFEVEGKTMRLRSRAEISALAVDEGVVEALKGSLEMLYGISDRVETAADHHFQSLYAHLDVEFYGLTAGAHDFVWFHEYAHLLLGHLVLGSCPDVENEADWFAASIIAEGSRDNGLYSVGMVIMVMILILMETQKGTPVTPTHPIAGARLLTVLSVFEEPERSALVELVDAVQNVLGPVLRKLGYKSFFILL